MKKLYFLSIIFIISSCGGGGGGGSSPSTPVIPSFSITLGMNAFTVNEDEIYEGSIAATANEAVTLQYTITEEPSNGSLTLSSTGAITYRPTSNYFGPDQFKYSVTAVEKNVTETATVNINVNSVNDAPELIIISFSNSDSFVFPDEQISVDVSISDIDNDVSSLTFSATSPYGNPLVSVNTSGDQITIDPSDITIGGLIDLTIILSDGESQTEKQITFWNLKKINSIYEDNLTYTFFGNELNSSRRFNYVFLIDGIDNNSDYNNIRDGLREWLDFINDSDIKYFVDNFFNIHVIELNDEENPIKVQTGATIKEDNDFDNLTDDELDDFYEDEFEPAGCSYRDADIYCFNSDFVTDVEDFIKESGFNSANNISIITGVEGRGTACPGCSTPINIQDYFIGSNAPEDVYVRSLFMTLKHEFGHTFNDLNDEYDSDYWDPEDNPDGAINCLAASDYYDDLIEYDENEDGSFDDDELTEIERSGIVFDWNCYWVDGAPNTTSEDNPLEFKWRHLFDNPDNIPGYHDENNQEGVGIFTGTYYGINYTFRPTYENVMNGSTGDGYEQWWYYANKTNGNSWDKVGVEAFAIQALKYQGMHDIDVQFNNSNATISLDLVIPNDIFDIEWYLDGQNDPTLKNKTNFSIDKKSSGWEKIAYRIVEKSFPKKYLFASDDLDNYADVYDGFFSSYDQAHLCDEPYSNEEGYEESICFGTVSGYDVETDNWYGGYDIRNIEDFYSWDGSGNYSETSHWAEYFVEYSGLGGQIVINWSNL